MVDIPNPALPYFGLIFIGFACGKAKGLPSRAWRGWTSSCFMFRCPLWCSESWCGSSRPAGWCFR